MCVHCKDLGYRLRRCRTMWGEPSLGINILEFSGAERACGVLTAFSIRDSRLPTTGIRRTFIFISSTRSKSNLESGFQPRAGEQNPSWFLLAAVSRVVVLVRRLKVTTNEQRRPRWGAISCSLSAQSNKPTDSEQPISTAAVSTQSSIQRFQVFARVM